MVNSDEFIKRLEIILDYYNLSASVFADKMGVQRSSLSHLMSGRNKPSLDFVMKIVENFPEVGLYWLLQGTGSFPKNENEQHQIYTPSSLPPQLKNDAPVFDLFSEEEKNETNLTDIQSQKESVNQDLIFNNQGDIDRIVVFYSNGTFKSYFPEK